MSKKILIAWHTGCQNKGCEALLAGAIKQCREYFGENCDIICPTKTVLYDQKIFPTIRFVPFVNWKGDWRFELLNVLEEKFKIKAVYNNLLFFLKKNSKIKNYFIWRDDIIDCIKEADLLLCIGGDRLCECYGKIGLHSSYEYINLAEKYNKKIILAGQSIGSFSPANLKYSKKILSKASLVTVREPETFSYLKKTQFDMSNIKLTKDFAFDFPKKSCNFENQDAKLKIGINISAGIENFKTTKHLDYFTFNLNLIKNLLEKYSSANIFLFPHVFEKNNDDRIICDKIVQLINNDRLKNICPGDKDMEAGQIKYIISNMEVFIGARMHSTIAAISSEVPAIILSYSIKAKGMFKYIFETDYYMHYLDLQTLSLRKLLEMIEYNLNNREDIILTIRKRLKELSEIEVF